MLAFSGQDTQHCVKGKRRIQKIVVKGKRKSINVHKLYDIFEAYSLHESVIVKDNMLAKIEKN